MLPFCGIVWIYFCYIFTMLWENIVTPDIASEFGETWPSEMSEWEPNFLTLDFQREPSAYPDMYMIQDEAKIL